MSSPTAKPLPVPDARSSGYWEAAANHVLAIARCDRCRTYQHPPTIVCPACLRPDARFLPEPVSGRGRVRSWTIIRQSFLPGFDDDLPYLLADIELDEQADLRLIAPLLVDADSPPTLGDRVTVDFVDRAPGVSLPVFRPEGDRPEGDTPEGDGTDVTR